MSSNHSNSHFNYKSIAVKNGFRNRVRNKAKQRFCYVLKPLNPYLLSARIVNTDRLFDYI